MYYNEETIIYLDGKWVKAKSASTDLYSQTLHYGAGVFEGIRSYKTEDGAKVFKAKEHYERLLLFCRENAYPIRIFSRGVNCSYL